MPLNLECFVLGVAQSTCQRLEECRLVRLCRRRRFQETLLRNLRVFGRRDDSYDCTGVTHSGRCGQLVFGVSFWGFGKGFGGAL